MQGFLIIDKPLGLTSFDVVRRVRRLLRIKRVGHCGTLDPLATGLLPVAVGEATRLVEFVMEGSKTYRASLCLGSTTATQDSEGEVLETRPVPTLDRDALAAVFRRFCGVQQQIPPMYSALKRDGVPLYRLARQGVEVERVARTVEISRLELLTVELPLVTFEVTCSKGTYVRTLAHDLGQTLGCGAHLTMLRRIACGPFLETDAVSLEALGSVEAPVPVSLLPTAAAMVGYPALQLVPAAVQRLYHGVPPSLADVVVLPRLEPGAVVTMQQDGRLLAVARFAPERTLEMRGDFELLRVMATVDV